MPLRFLLLLFLIFFSFCLSAQSPAYPKFYFRNPLGIPMKLVANFGELRPNHWHMGLDIRTNQKVNFPVYAAAAGYIVHVGIRPQSFGRYIIINHPNGLSTLYAHLNNFFPELEQYAREQQYNEESWEVELDILKNKFPVTQGQLIAYSGNTGGSQGPHLHFEIRDTKSGKCLNPLLFGFPLQDKVAPNLVKLAMYDRNHSIFEQTPVFFFLKNTDSGYIIPKIPVIQTGWKKVSFSVQAFDRMTGSDNPNGIYAATLFFDDRPVIGFVLDSIDYTATQYVDAQIDYSYRYDGGPFLQHLSRLPGDRGGVYHLKSGDGVIHLPDTLVHTVRIDVKDAHFNVSQLNFAVQYADSLAMRDGNDRDSNRDLPRHFLPNQVNVLKKPEFEMYLPENCLYDSIQPIYFRNNSSLSNAVSALHQVNDPSIPLHANITIRIKPDKQIPENWKNKLVIQRNSRGSISVRKAAWETDDSTGTRWLTAKFGDFGSFQAFADTEAPGINDLGTGDTIDMSPETRIVLLPTDNFGVIKNFRAELDSQWICFTNDKGKYWVYNFDEHCPFGVHQLKVTVEDLVGNTTTKKWWFKRYPYEPPKKKASGKKQAGSRIKKKESVLKKTVSKKKK
jgi:Peptidase family M23